MPSLFSDNVLDQIRDKCNIAEIIAQHIPLKRSGRNFKGLCPFHHEKTPSFMVSPDKGIFHCFGCGAGGNVFNFIMKQEGLEFPQAVRLLAEKAGVKLAATSMFSQQRQKDTQDIFQINELACSWYEANLQKEAHPAALNYLKKRNFQAKTITAFRLGYASSDNGLLNFLRAKGIALDSLEKAGLIIRKENGLAQDRFKQRLIFPILDSRSKIIAFGGRVLDDSLPKYVNSPETPVYNKGSHLYGLNVAKEEIKKNDFCIIVEGYIDLLRVYQSGISNVCASLGTALTVQQLRLLRRFTKNVVVIFDADRAGELASLRSLDLLLEEDMQVKVVSLTQGEDPDSFLLKFGKESFQKKIETASELFDYKLNLLSRNYNIETTEGKVNIAAQMLPTIQRVQNAIRRGAYVRRLAEALSRGEKSLGEEWILAELKKVKTDWQNYSQETVSQKEHLFCRPAEEMLLKILLDQEIADEVSAQLALEEFQDLRIREAMRLIYQARAQGQTVGAAKLISQLKTEEAAQLISRVSSRADNFLDYRRCLRDCITRIKQDNLQGKLNKLQREIKLAEGWGHQEKLTGLVSQYNQLIKTRGKPECPSQLVKQAK